MRLRLPTAARGYFRDPWNYVDLLNYALFLFALALRVKVSLYGSTFSRTVWRLYGGTKDLMIWYSRSRCASRSSWPSRS
jgi:hypothetical protein